MTPRAKASFSPDRVMPAGRWTPAPPPPDVAVVDRGPTPLVPSGISVVGGPSAPDEWPTLVADTDGVLWAVGSAGVLRYEPPTGRRAVWTVASDAAFGNLSPMFLVAAREGGVWLAGGMTPTLRRFDGERFVSTPLPVAPGQAGWGWYQWVQQDRSGDWWIPTRDGLRRYEGNLQGRPISATVSSQRCIDNMSGMPYPLTAEVRFDGRVLKGCGGNPADLLIGAEWVVEEITGGMLERSRATLTFDADGRLSGRASCNSFFASYTLTGEGLGIGQAGTTRMACAPELMQQEARFLDILKQVQRFEIAADGALLLASGDGRRIKARRGP